ncbi:hypothetical protein [Labrys neptuniae]
MAGHIAIGTVYARAWSLFRQRFVILVLLNLLQTLSLGIGLFLHDLLALVSLYPTAPYYYFLYTHPAGLFGVPVAGGILFLLASMSMVMVMNRDRLGGGFWSRLLRRFVPALLAVTLCFSALALIFYGWGSLIDSVSRAFSSMTVIIGISLVALVLLIVVSALLFATLPAVTLERGGPLRAIRRSVFLTTGQRWRIGAIILTLILALLVALMVLRIAAPMIGNGLGLYDPMTLAAALSIVSGLFLLCLTLVITAAYQQMVRVKDGISVEDAGKIFE